MMGIGPLELMLILIVALVVVGPKKLPEIGRQIGKVMRDLRRMQDEVKDTIRFDLDDEDDEPPTARVRSSDRSGAHDRQSRSTRTATMDDEDDPDPDEDDLPTARPASGSAHARAAAREREMKARETSAGETDPSTNGHGPSTGDAATTPSDEAG
jgi:sec-independent protein translocase protein TatA